jgi:aldehyde dehydrogenase
MSVYAAPGQPDSVVSFASRYDHWIGGEYVPPAKGGYFENVSPINGKPFTEIARGTAADVEAALDAAEGAAPAWGRTPVATRANLLNKIADRMEEPSRSLRSPRPGRTANGYGKPWPPTCRSLSITSATSPAL